MEHRTADLVAHPGGAAPEEVLVLEIAGDVPDFIKAVNRTVGMEWLVESEEFDIDADEDFSRDDDHPEEPVKGRLFLVMANQQALQQLRALWLTYQDFAGEETPAEWPYGQTKWRDLFSHLHNIRYWGIEDRLRSTGLLEDWAERLAEGTETVPLELELWFRQSPDQRQADEVNLRTAIEANGGEVISRSEIPEIGYHAVLARLLIAAAQDILNRGAAPLARSNQVMFLRPVGQTASRTVPLEVGTDATDAPPLPQPLAEPLVALFDGLPMGNHSLLQNRLIIDDPDDWAPGYQVADRRHGTGMASIILHGDLSTNSPPSPRPLYVRPVMRPITHLHGANEGVPDDVLAVDLLHSAIRRLYMPEGDLAPVAPTVRLVNYSLGDAARPFDTFVSPLARLLDWMAWTHGTLFIVSSGNCPQDIALNVTAGALATMTPLQRDEEILRSLWNDAFQRRILSPAESVNALTVAAVHSDSSVPAIPAAVSMLTAATYPSPLNPFGFGFRRGLKPDVLEAGGRQPYREAPATGATTAMVLTPIEAGAAPGIKVASPSPNPGDVKNTTHTRGTSNATALVTRTAEKVYDMLRSLTAGNGIEDVHLTLLTKALVAHSARWPDSRDIIANVVGNSRERISRLLGYGRIDPYRALTSTDQRVTLIGWGKLPLDQADLYTVPLPITLSGQPIRRRLIVTLAWFTPISYTNRKYRSASLRIEPIDADQLSILQVSRSEADPNTASRGTLQHEVMVGNHAALFDDDSVLSFRIACKAEAGGVSEIPYGVAFTLEVAEGEPVPVYTEVQTRVQTLIPVVTTL